MAKDLKEQIEIMTHYLNGGAVEFSDDKFKTLLGEANKEDDEELCWNWDEFDYRIKKEKQKVTIERWLCRDRYGDFIAIETSNIDKYKLYVKIKLLEAYEIEL